MKKGWKLVLCIDYCAFNQETVKDKFPILVIDELLDKLLGPKLFSKIELRFGYYQIRVMAEDILKTALRTHEGHYEFLVRFFGLNNTLSTFEGLMNEVFLTIFEEFCVSIFL